MNLQVDVTDVVDATGLTGTRLIQHQRRKKDLIKLIAKHLPLGCRLLDVGCASGDIATELGIMGYRVHGIDFEPERLKRAQRLAKKYGQDITFTQSSFDDFDQREAFDGIILGEVLEHFSDPGVMLKKAEQILNEDGKIILTTPNMPSLNNRLKFFFLGVFPDNNPEHKFYFDNHRLKEVIDGTNLIIKFFETRYANLQTSSVFLTSLENVFFGWFPKLFPKSGNTIFAVLSMQTHSGIKGARSEGDRPHKGSVPK